MRMMPASVKQRLKTINRTGGQRFKMRSKVEKRTKLENQRLSDKKSRVSPDTIDRPGDFLARVSGRAGWASQATSF